MSSPTKTTRRGFLRGAAALAAPLIIPASVLGRAGATAPSERISMGFIGIGLQGGGHLLGGAWTYLTGGYTARNDVQVLAVCDVWRERREQVDQRTGADVPVDLSRGEHPATCAPAPWGCSRALEKRTSAKAWRCQVSTRRSLPATAGPILRAPQPGH